RPGIGGGSAGFLPSRRGGRRRRGRPVPQRGGGRAGSPGVFRVGSGVGGAPGRRRGVYDGGRGAEGIAEIYAILTVGEYGAENHFHGSDRRREKDGIHAAASAAEGL